MFSLMFPPITMIEVIGASQVSNWEPTIWQGAVVHTSLPLAPSFTDAQKGDFVKFDGQGRIVRSPSAWEGAYVDDFQGLIVSTVPDNKEHPAFSPPYDRPLVALLQPNKTELLMREMDFAGNYVAPTLRHNEPVVFVFDPILKRWGVQYASRWLIPTGRVLKVLSDGRLLILFGEY
jgi:hypothetical protein